MGCKLCSKCGKKYEQSSAEEYYGPNADGEYPSSYAHCPDCDKKAKAKKESAKDEELKQLRAKCEWLEAALKRATRDSPPGKKQKTESVLPKNVWHVTKADLPGYREELATCDVIGTYLSQAKAEEAMAAFLEEGNWQEGYGYHQGEDAESNIEVVRSRLTA